MLRWKKMKMKCEASSPSTTIRTLPNCCNQESSSSPVMIASSPSSSSPPSPSLFPLNKNSRVDVQSIQTTIPSSTAAPLILLRKISLEGGVVTTSTHSKNQYGFSLTIGDNEMTPSTSSPMLIDDEMTIAAPPAPPSLSLPSAQLQSSTRGNKSEKDGVMGSYTQDSMDESSSNAPLSNINVANKRKRNELNNDTASPQYSTTAFESNSRAATPVTANAVSIASSSSTTTTASSYKKRKTSSYAAVASAPGDTSISSASSSSTTASLSLSSSSAPPPPSSLVPIVPSILAQPVPYPNSNSNILLLATPGDAKHLNPLHCYVRRHIEVFLASPLDLSAPAPGRKNKVQLRQVGLRCIFCSSSFQQQQQPPPRVKRAICYPTSLSRIYHSVSDMKFDHFGACKNMPPEEQKEFARLKSLYKRRGLGVGNGKEKNNGGFSSTAQYYQHAAKVLGLYDGNNGVFFKSGGPQEVFCQPIGSGGGGDGDASGLSSSSSSSSAAMNPQETTMSSSSSASTTTSYVLPKVPKFIDVVLNSNSNSSSNAPQDENQEKSVGGEHKKNVKTLPLSKLSPPPPSLSMLQTSSTTTAPSYKTNEVVVMEKEKRRVNTKKKQTSNSKKPTTTTSRQQQPPPPTIQPNYSHPQQQQQSPPILLLATSTDTQTLPPIHCFIRRQISVFSATQTDIAAPSPGRKTQVKLHQVGIRCIHCAHLPLKHRVKRAVCYPPTMAGIYHSISNMKFDHFGACKGLSVELRKEFESLRKKVGGGGSGSGGGGGRRGNGGGGRSGVATAQFYLDSAKRLGLVDTEHGIRFANNSHRHCPPPSPPQGNNGVIKHKNTKVLQQQKKTLPPPPPPPPLSQETNTTFVNAPSPFMMNTSPPATDIYPQAQVTWIAPSYHHLPYPPPPPPPAQFQRRTTHPPLPPPPPPSSQASITIPTTQTTRVSAATTHKKVVVPQGMCALMIAATNPHLREKYELYKKQYQQRDEKNGY